MIPFFNQTESLQPRFTGLVNNEKYLEKCQCCVCCIPVCVVVHLISAVSFSLTMVPAAVTISPMDPSSQDVEDTEASTPLHPLQDGCQGRAAPSGWLPFFKPILAVSFGTLLFVLGTTLSLLYFTQVGNIPYLLGPLFLAAGLMFLVTGLVWIPVLKESLEHHALIKVSHGKELQVEHKHH